MVDFNKGKNDNIFAVKRELEDNIIIGVLNFSNEKQLLSMDNDMLAGTYTNVFNDEKFYPGVGFTFELEPWSYLLLVKE